MHISRYTCKYIHIHSNTYKSCTVCPRLCKEMPHPGQAMPLVCMYLYVFASIWSICVYEFADTCRYMQIHAYTYIYTQTRIHVAVRSHVTSLGPLTWDHFRSSLGPLSCDTRQSLHWGNWHGILLDCALQAGRVAAGRQRSIFGENSKSSAPRYDSQLTLLSKQTLPGFLLIPIFDWLFSTDQLSCFSYRAVQDAEYCLDFESSIMLFFRFSTA